MQVEPSSAVAAHTAQAVISRRFLAWSSRLLGAALLASGLITWVAANWPHWHPDTRLQLGQAAVLVLALLAWLTAWRGLRRQPPTATPWHDASPAALLAGLAAVATGGLLAMLGQYHQTGANPAWLFLGWALLTLPWLWAVRSLFLVLLTAVLLNTGVALWLDGTPDLFDARLCAGLAALNLILLALREAAGRWLHDPWRVAPRALLAAASAALWLTAAASHGDDGQTTAIALAAMALLAGVAYGYRGPRDEPGMRTIAAIGIFSLAALLGALWGEDAGELILLMIALLALAALLLRHMVGPVSGPAWLPAAFRYVVMIAMALLLLGLLYLVVDPGVNDLIWAAIVLAAAALALWRIGAHEGLRLTASMLAAAATLLVGAWTGFSEQYADATRLLVLMALLVPLYLGVGSGPVRLLAALTGLGLALLLTWGEPWFDTPGTADAGAVYPRLLLLSWAALALWRLAARHAAPGSIALADRLAPLAWACTLLAQALAWAAPTLTPAGWARWAADAPLGVVCAVLVALTPGLVLIAAMRRHPATGWRWWPLLVLAVASVGWWAAPAVGLAIAWLLVAQALRQPALKGAAIVLLLGSLAFYYFQLDIRLLDKALILALTGLWLSLAGWLVRLPNAAEPAADATTALASRWRMAALPLGAVLVLAVAQASIREHRHILAEGQTVSLALAPVDPRSLVQGDYMALRFAVEPTVIRLLREAEATGDQALANVRRGYVLMRADDQGPHDAAAVFPTLAAARAAARPDDAIMAFRRLPGARIWLGTDAWFFAEGEAERHANARFGEFRVLPDGRARLLRLR